MACSESNNDSAIAFASSVFPTPVGPTKRNEPIGQLGSCKPVLDLLIAFEIDSIAIG